MAACWARALVDLIFGPIGKRAWLCAVPLRRLAGTCAILPPCGERTDKARVIGEGNDREAGGQPLPAGIRNNPMR